MGGRVGAALGCIFKKGNCSFPCGGIVSKGLLSKQAGTGVLAALLLGWRERFNLPVELRLQCRGLGDKKITSPFFFVELWRASPTWELELACVAWEGEEEEGV